MPENSQKIFFEFSDNVIPTVISEISKAREFIRIAIFQLHNLNVFNVLNTKIKDGVKVEIFTLPYDSINADVQEMVIKQFEILQTNGATLHFCRWNVGDPERTTTAVGRWYSYHGKFIVTDKSAVSLSANFTSNNELDATIIYRDNQDKIAEFNEKFNKLLEWFVFPNSGFDGTLRSLVFKSVYLNPEVLFEVPRSINGEVHENHWIKDYPSELCPENVEIKDELYICPLEVRGRNFIGEIIRNAKDFLYISTESFTDENVMDELIRKKINENIDIYILTGAQSMDYSDRLNSMLRQLLASGIVVKTTESDLHAKLIISKGLVAVGSINLNKMNLGFSRTSSLWRENTETISVCTDKDIIQSAKSQFASVFENSIHVSITLAEKIEGQVKTILKKYFDLNSKQDAKKIFSRYILVNEIQVKKIALKIGSISKRLIENQRSRTVSKEVLLMALTLYFLSERKHNAEQLNDKFKPLDVDFDINLLLADLLENNYIEQEDDYYKLKVESLF